MKIAARKHNKLFWMINWLKTRILNCKSYILITYKAEVPNRSSFNNLFQCCSSFLMYVCITFQIFYCWREIWSQTLYYYIHIFLYVVPRRTENSKNSHLHVRSSDDVRYGGLSRDITRLHPIQSLPPLTFRFKVQRPPSSARAIEKKSKIYNLFILLFSAICSLHNPLELKLILIQERSFWWIWYMIFSIHADFLEMFFPLQKHCTYSLNSA